MNSNKTEETPFACNMKALSGEQRKRYATLLKHFEEAREEVKELPDGYAFRFPADPQMIQETAEFIGYEHACCPFFDIELAVEGEGGPLWLRLKGREGIKKFIETEFELK